MMKRTRTRLGGIREQGFTVIELLAVLIIVSLLLAIAVPSYLQFRDRAANNAAKASLRAALPSAETYHAAKGTYVGMDAAALQAIDSSVSPTLKVTTATATSFTMCDDPSGKAWQVAGPDTNSASFTTISNC
jgi:type IV pilus assembly protein PilA